jgi:Family of unknown function (DUF5317)
MQLVLGMVVSEGDHGAHRVAHVATYALAAYAIARNLSLPYIWLVALGGALNLAAILANGGVMPASPAALERAGLDMKPGEFTNSDAVEDPQLGFLGDVLAIPAGVPGANVFSVGDVLLLLGGFLALHALTGSGLARRLRRVPARVSCRARRRPAESCQATPTTCATPQSPRAESGAR